MKDIMKDTWIAIKDVGAWISWISALFIICWFLFFNNRGANPPAPRLASYIEVATERCLYGDGDYEPCQDAAYKYAEEKGLAW